MFTDVGIFVHLTTKLEVMVRLAYIICITKITFKFIHNVLLVISEGFVFMTFKSSEIFLLVKTFCSSLSILFSRSHSCLRTVSADFWSLKGNMICTGLSAGSIRFWIPLMYLLWKSGCLFSCASFSMEHIKGLAIRGPNGEPMEKPSIGLYTSPLNWKSSSLVAIVSSSIRPSLTDAKVMCVVKPVPIECFLC